MAKSLFPATYTSERGQRKCTVVGERVRHGWSILCVS